ncbi:MAG TPA: hypothetical protein VHT27_08570 [Solirubrobacteraceae bacterium]|nr:hypothetical protein [Solirubrobacteraceae bacterium]
MTARDRNVLIVVVLLAILGAGWMLVVSPERGKASKLATQISTAQATLSAAEGKLSEAHNAQAQYATAYAAVVGLGKAVPASDEVPSLIYQLERASSSKNVDFSSITSTLSSSSSSSSATTAAAASAAGFSQMPFTFVFSGSFFDLEHLFAQLDRFTLRTPTGTLQVSGRLLTIQEVKLAPAAAGGVASSNQLSGTISAVAYVLPGTQGLTAGATPLSPSGTSATVSGSGSSTPATPAVVEATP